MFLSKEQNLSDNDFMLSGKPQYLMFHLSLSYFIYFSLLSPLYCIFKISLSTSRWQNNDFIRNSHLSLNQIV